MARALFLLLVVITFFGCEDNKSFSLKSGKADVRNEAVVSRDEKGSATNAPKSEQVELEHASEAQDSEEYLEEFPEVGPKVKRAKDWRERIEREKRTEVTWEDLYEFDYKKGTPTPFLKAISGKRARLAGFVIPLTDGDAEKMREFLIVPEPMMCIHVPPPPPNLLLYGTANPPISINSLWEPVWLEGEIKVEKKESIYAEAGFTMNVTGVEPYEEQD